MLKEALPALRYEVGEARWTHQLINHLELLVSRTREQDWIDGRPIVWLSIAETGRLLGIRKSQVNSNERALFALGALVWKDSPNCKRYGYRNARGKIVEAYGINLAPLMTLTETIRPLKNELEQQHQHRKKMKRELTTLRRHLRGIFDCREEWGIDLSEVETEFNALVEAMRVRDTTPIEQIEAWHEALQGLLERVDSAVQGEIGENLQNSGETSSNTGAKAPHGLEAHILQNSGIELCNTSSPPSHDEPSPNEPASSASEDAGKEKQVENSENNPDDPTPEDAQHWDEVSKRLRSKIGDSHWRSWIKPLELVLCRESIAWVMSPSRLGVARVQTDYAGLIREHSQAYWREIRVVSRQEREKWASRSQKPPLSTTGASKAVSIQVDWGRLLRSLPKPISEHLGANEDLSDVLTGAGRLCIALGISRSAWIETLRVLSEEKAALCLLVVAVKYHRGLVTSPGGYLRGMTRKAEKNLLNLMPSIFGIQSGQFSRIM